MPRTKRNRNVIIAFVLIIGIGISIGNFHYINITKIYSNQQLVSQAIDETNKKLNKELQKVALAITSLQVLFETADTINREVFEHFTTPFIRNLPGVKALEWAPKILDEQKGEYNRLLQAEGFEGHTILEANFAKKKLIPVSPKSYYYPVQFIAPPQLNKIAIGYDLSSSPDRNACIISSQKKNAIVVSPPLKLVQNTNNSYSFLVVRVVQKSNGNQGVILGVYNMNDFINTVLKSELELLDILIYDKISNTNAMYSNTDDSLWLAVPSTKDHFKININDRTWLVYYRSKQSMVAYPHLPISYGFLLLGTLITFLLILVFYMNANSNLYLEQKIKKRTQALNQSNKEQAVLLKEIHHRVKNNLQVITSLLSLQSTNIETPSVKEIFSVSQYRINTMAILHEELYQSDNLSKIGYGQYLNKLVLHLIQSIKGNQHQINLNVDIPDGLKLNLDTAIPLGLLINEIVTNALKYGIPKQSSGIIYIQIIPQTYPNFKLLIGDNGIGYSDKINFRTTKSLGLKLIHQLTRQLNGSIEKNKNKKGTHYEIYFQETD